MCKIPNSRRAKQWIKNYLRKHNIPIVAKYGRLFVVLSTVNFACMRYYGWSVIRENHESLDKMIVEHTSSLPHHGFWGWN